MESVFGYFILQIRNMKCVTFDATELFGQNDRLFRTEPCRSSTLILACASVANPVRSHGLPPRRTSCSAPPSSRCAALSVYFNTNLGSTLSMSFALPREL